MLQMFTFLLYNYSETDTMKFFLLSSILVALLQDGYGYNCEDDRNCDFCMFNSCEYCSSNYYPLDDGTCGTCSDVFFHCSDCNDDYGYPTCTGCNEFYGIDGNQRCSRCSDAIPNCRYCDVTSACNDCDVGYQFYSDNTCRPIRPTCSVTPRPIQHYPDLYRGSIIFVDFPFQCDGSVSGVEFYAERAGTFYFSAWRPSASGDSWRLLGYNTIVSEEEGSQIFTIPSDEQMTVEATDVFGFFYERGVYRVISSANIHKRARDGTSSRFVRTGETLGDLSIGVSRSNLAGGGNTERIVPINAIIR